MAVGLLLAIGAVLAWGTIYEARFGTAAVQQLVYRSWWFDALLAFLGLNLTAAAASRYPWQRHHAPFVLAHIGIILILIGGVLGSRFGIEGQLIIPEGEVQGTLQLPRNVLTIHEPNPGVSHVLATSFESTAWVHEPKTAFTVGLKDRTIELTVDRYYPDAAVTEQVSDGGPAENPAVQVVVSHDGEQDTLWLLSRDPERFGARWGQAHLLFLEPDAQELTQLMGGPSADVPSRGRLSLTFSSMGNTVELPVPDVPGHPIPIDGTPYLLTFKDYFPDAAITEHGLMSRSDAPRNPAVSFILSGPEGTDAHLAFARHPDFPALHGITYEIPVQVRYVHALNVSLPPQAISLLRLPSGGLAAIFTGADGAQQSVDALDVGRRYRHPWLGYEVEVTQAYSHARIEQQFTNRGNEVRAEALHIVGRDGIRSADAWLSAQSPVELPLGEHSVVVEYRPAQRELPFTIKLLDFRKIDYPGTQMAAGFESDVELTDPQRGLILLRKISMNHPLRYRGYSFYQSSYIEGPTESTVLSVRNDPGTPFVYAGFLIVIGGVVAMFLDRSRRPLEGTP